MLEYDVSNILEKSVFHYFFYKVGDWNIFVETNVPIYSKTQICSNFF